MSERIIVTFEFDADSDQRDSADASGLTEEAFASLHDSLRALGASDIGIVAQ